MRYYGHRKHMTDGDVKEVTKFNSPYRTKLQEYDTMLGEGNIDR